GLRRTALPSRIRLPTLKHTTPTTLPSHPSPAQTNAMVCINIIAADSNRDAEFLFTSMQQAFVKLRRGETGQLPPPIQNMDQFWSPSEQYGVQQALSMSLVGDKAKVRHGLQSILRETDADEIMVNGQIFDHQARLHSFELAMDVKEELLG
ncbi:hypothetical protein ACSLN5_14140, partial [Escherichia coli]